MSNHTTPKQTERIWNEHVKRKMTNPNDWIILNRPNCVDVVCNTVITMRDREILKAYFVNAEMCIWAWQNGLKHRNIVHLIGKGLRKRCQFCKKTYSVDDLAGYRIHVIKDHIARNKFGSFKYIYPMELPPPLMTTITNETPNIQLTKIQQRQQQILTEITPRLIRHNTYIMPKTRIHIEK